MYKPSRSDVAKLVSSASALPAPEAMILFHYLVAGIPGLHDLWNNLDRRIGGEVALSDIILLYLCLTEHVESERAYGAAVWMVRQIPETERLWQEIEAFGGDAGMSIQYGSFPTEILATHAELELLLASEWEHPEEIVDPCGEGFNHEWMVKTLGTRIARSEGDISRRQEVRTKLCRDAILNSDRRDWLVRKSIEKWLQHGFDLLFGLVWVALLVLVVLIGTEKAGWFADHLGWLMALSGMAAWLMKARLKRSRQTNASGKDSVRG